MIQLTEVEARVLGCLVEKSLTTPELYPLTMNALVNACNQKSSRDPVMSLDEAAVGKGLHSLLERSLAGRLHEAGSRVPKFMHHVETMLDGADAKVVGALCVLLLRGPQTPGEIKGRTERLCQFASTAEVESLLQDLAAKPEPWVEKLPRQAGQKEVRWRHLFSTVAPERSPAPVPSEKAPTEPAPAKTALPRADDRVERLEKRVAALEELVQKLAAGG